MHDILPSHEWGKCISTRGKKIDCRYRVRLLGVQRSSSYIYLPNPGAHWFRYIISYFHTRYLKYAVLQLCILLQDFQDLFSCEFHGDKDVIERKKGENLLQGNPPFGDIVPYGATVDEGYIRACLLPHDVTYKTSYVGFSLVVPY